MQTIPALGKTHLEQHQLEDQQKHLPHCSALQELHPSRRALAAKQLQARQNESLHPLPCRLRGKAEQYDHILLVSRLDLGMSRGRSHDPAHVKDPAPILLR